jgi:hypothetical protein
MNMKRDGTGMIEVLLVKANGMPWGLPRAFGARHNPTNWIAFGLDSDETEVEYTRHVPRDGGRAGHVIASRKSGDRITVSRVGSANDDHAGSHSSSEPVERRKEVSTNIQAVENFLLDNPCEYLDNSVLGNGLDTDEAWVSTTVRHLHDEHLILDKCQMTPNARWFSVNEHIGSWLTPSTNDEILIRAAQVNLGAYWG